MSTTTEPPPGGGVDPPEGQEPTGTGGQEPGKTTPGGSEPDDRRGQEPASGERDPEHLRQEIERVRREAAGARVAKGKAEAALNEVTRERDDLRRERDDAQKERDDAQRDAQRLRLAYGKGLPLDLADLVPAGTDEEMEAAIDRILPHVGSTGVRPPAAAGFDGGARKTPDQKGSPEEEHAKLILGLTGRGGG